MRFRLRAAAPRGEIAGIAAGVAQGASDVERELLRITADYTGSAGLTRVRGRGGTDTRVGIDAALERKPRPDAIVVFTDGETHWPDTKPVVPLVVCLVGDTAEAAASRVPEWAVALAVDDD